MMLPGIRESETETQESRHDFLFRRIEMLEMKSDVCVQAYQEIYNPQRHHPSTDRMKKTLFPQK